MLYRVASFRLAVTKRLFPIPNKEAHYEWWNWNLEARLIGGRHPESVVFLFTIPI